MRFAFLVRCALCVNREGVTVEECVGSLVGRSSWLVCSLHLACQVCCACCSDARPLSLSPRIDQCLAGLEDEAVAANPNTMLQACFSELNPTKRLPKDLMAWRQKSRLRRSRGQYSRKSRLLLSDMAQHPVQPSLACLCNADTRNSIA